MNALFGSIVLKCNHRVLQILEAVEWNRVQKPQMHCDKVVVVGLFFVVISAWCASSSPMDDMQNSVLTKEEKAFEQCLRASYAPANPLRLTQYPACQRECSSARIDRAIRLQRLRKSDVPPGLTGLEKEYGYKPHTDRFILGKKVSLCRDTQDIRRQKGRLFCLLEFCDVTSLVKGTTQVLLLQSGCVTCLDDSGGVFVSAKNVLSSGLCGVVSFDAPPDTSCLRDCPDDSAACNMLGDMHKNIRSERLFSLKNLRRAKKLSLSPDDADDGVLPDGSYEACQQCRYYFGQDYFAAQQVICTYANGSQFVIRTIVHYTNLMDVEIVCGVPDGDTMYDGFYTVLHFPRCTCFSGTTLLGIKQGHMLTEEEKKKIAKSVEDSAYKVPPS